MKIKILEYKAFQGNECTIKSHNYRKGKWKINPKFELHRMLIAQTPARFLWHKIYDKEIEMTLNSEKESER